MILPSAWIARIRSTHSAGEGSEATSDLYQISNQVTLGVSEKGIVSEFERAGIVTTPKFAIGQRPLLLLGVLLIVVGIQLFTIGLVSEMLQRYHVRSQADEARARVERVLR